MKVQGINSQQLVELQRAAVIRTHEEERYRKIVEDTKKIIKGIDTRNQELRTEANRRLGRSKGQNVDIEC